MTCTHPDDIAENLPEPLDTLAAEYEGDYYDSHFSVGEDGITACEASFDGWGCPACADSAQDYVEWEKCPHYDPNVPLPASGYDEPPTIPDALKELVGVD